jgi:hypothetical protein
MIKHLDKYILNRRYENLPSAKLRRDWLAAFAAAAIEIDRPSDSAARTELDDLTAEYHFRGTTPPYYQMKIEAHECIRAVDAALEVLRNEYPAGWAAAMRDLQSAINGGAIDGETGHPVWSGTRDEPLDKYFPRSSFCE